MDWVIRREMTEPRDTGASATTTGKKTPSKHRQRERDVFPNTDDGWKRDALHRKSVRIN